MTDARGRYRYARREWLRALSMNDAAPSESAAARAADAKACMMAAEAEALGVRCGYEHDGCQVFAKDSGADICEPCEGIEYGIWLAGEPD